MSVHSLRNSTDPAAAPGVLAELVEQGARQFVVTVLDGDGHLSATGPAWIQGSHVTSARDGRRRRLNSLWGGGEKLKGWTG